MKFTHDQGQKPNKKMQSLSMEQRLFFNIEHPSKRIQCDDCRRNISKQSRIIAQYPHAVKDYCLACFSNLDPLPETYHITNKLDYPLLENSWSAGEEVLFLEGLQSLGFGNWNEIAEFMGSKTREQIQEHYQTVYLQQQNFMPKTEILAHRNEGGILVHPPLLPSRGQERGGGPSQIKESKVGVQPGQIVPPAEVVGFMPRRGDFQTQYDNDAELLLAQMQFNDDDTEEEKAMKFRLIDIYNHKLTERIKRKRFVIERKLLDIKEQLRLDKTRTKEEKEIYNLMKVVARFSTPENHEKLVQGIIREKQLRQRIAELRELEHKGVRNLADIEEELEGKRKKDRRRDGDSYLDKSKTRRIARKDVNEQRSDKKVLYISKEEEQLCSSLNMTFKQYICLKEIILREAVRMGLLNKDQTTEQLKIARPAAERVFDFVVEQEGLQYDGRRNKGETMKDES